MLQQPYPLPNPERLMRCVQDVADLLQYDELDQAQDADKAIIRKITRWISHVLRKAQMNRRWWFLENGAVATIAAGQDLIDLKGHLHRISAVYAPKRLHLVSYERIVGLRARAAARKCANAGEPTHYALEAGRRIHLWPCPAADATPFVVVYQRPIHIAIVPDEWEAILLDGVLGMYGRHFDRNQLAHSPQEFERRWLASLRSASIDTLDVHVIKPWDDQSADRLLTADSATDTATTLIVPSSLSGVGFEMILQEGDPLYVEEGDGVEGDPVSTFGILGGEEELSINDGTEPAANDYGQEIE